LNDLVQFVAGRSGELGVQSQYLDGELHLVDDALAGAVAARKEFEVVRTVVGPNPVYVMDGFFGEKFASDAFRHDIAMFHDGVLFTGNEAGNRYPDVAVPFNMAFKFSSLEFSQSVGALMCSFARAVAKALLHVNTPAGFSTAALFFAALLAGKSLAFHRVFTSAEIRARHAAVERVSSIFVSIYCYCRGFVRERITAFFAGKFDHSYARSNSPVNGFVRSDTRFSAKTSGLMARFYGKICSALFANFDDRHGLMSCVGFSSGMLVR
jgi:hypothetical protein